MKCHYSLLIHISAQDSGTEFYFLLLKRLPCKVAKPDWKLSKDTDVNLWPLPPRNIPLLFLSISGLLDVSGPCPQLTGIIYVTTPSYRIEHVALASTNRHDPIHCIFRLDMTPLRPKRHKERLTGSFQNMEMSPYGRGSM